MDKIAEQLKADAERIEVQVSESLDRRIQASLRANSPEVPQQDPTPPRSISFWWASSLTGVAAALLIVFMANTGHAPRQDLQATPPAAAQQVAATPLVNWKAESAMLTSPLEQELLDLQSDLKKAELKVKQDIGL